MRFLDGATGTVTAAPASMPKRPLPELFTAGEWQALAKRFRLSRRQAQIARWICRGLSNPAIADELDVSLDTVRMHTRALYKKLDITVRVGVPVRLIVGHRSHAQDDQDDLD